MTIRTVKFMSLLALIITCAGCVKSPSLRPKNLNPLTKETARDCQTKEQVTVYAKKLSTADQQVIFGEYAHQLERHNIIPVQITVENNSGASLVLADKNIILNKLTTDQVNAKIFEYRRLRTRWILFAGLASVALVALGIGIWLFAPAMFHSIFILLIGLPLMAAILYIDTAPLILVIDTITRSMSRKQMQRYLKECCNAEGITLDPGITASMLFFVEEAQMPEKINLLLTAKNLEQSGLSFKLAI